ncbi:MAG TPA: VTT domain-containing protein [Bryobacteraceae bacterium]|nr:VTT domain-containing protein [Bryobacteraceae bacterium]
MSETVRFVVQHGYLLLFCWLLAEQAGLPVPSIPLLLACGALAQDGRMNPVSVLAYGLAACLLADSIWFHVGRRGGAKVLRLLCRIALEPDSCVRRTENALVRYGLRSMLVSKFIPGLNAVAAPMAGNSGARFERFLAFDALGTLMWIGCYLGAGYLFAGQLETIAAYAMRTGFGLFLALAVLVGAWIGWKFIQRRRFLRKLAVARITPEQLQDRIRGGAEVLLVDLRHQRTGLEEVPGALRIPAEELAMRHGEIPRDRDIILFCS